MVAGVEMGMESTDGPARPQAIELRLLGPMTVRRDGIALPLPASRKVRGLLAYLAMAPGPVQRGRLCELLWDVPNDPRGELRWALSKIRGVVDAPDRRRVVARDDTVALDLTDCSVDVLEVDRATRAGIETLDPERLRALSSLFAGELLEGLEIERSPSFNAWVASQRRHLHGQHVAILKRLVDGAGDDEVLGYLETFLRLAPLDQRNHELLLEALVRQGRLGEGEEHVAATIRLFESEGLDHTLLREFWRAAKRKAASRSSTSVSHGAASMPDKGNRAEDVGQDASRRASIAVMPFDDKTGTLGAWADGLVRDIIVRLAKLRCLFVIAHGTVFALKSRHVSPLDAGRTLNVDYVVTGSAQRRGERLNLAVELTATRTARIVWAETIDRKLDDLFIMLDEIGNRIVASVASEIEANERNRAILKPPGSLDAWEAHHRGLWHMYRFTRTDNERAAHFFRTSLGLDPTFARAYAGLSFTHWQNAFQGWAPRDRETDRAFEAAGQSMMADDRDPAAHWALGRALWLRNQQSQSIAELESAVDLSPNFAMGHYALAFVGSQAGDARAAIEASDYSRQLSPFDPLLFGMLGARSMALVRLGAFEEAAEWAIKAAARPNAHAHILAIAAYCLVLAGRLEDGRNYAAALKKAVPSYGIDQFLRAFRFEPVGEGLFRKAAKKIESAE